jgi:hypothetical protein
MFTISKGFQVVRLVDRRSVLATSGTESSQLFFDASQRGQLVGQGCDPLLDRHDLVCVGC